MVTHLTKQDRNLIREEAWFEEDILNSRRATVGPDSPVRKGILHNSSSSPIISTHIGDIISSLDCTIVRELREDLSSTLWEYKNVKESDEILFANYQEEIVGLWYRWWLNCIFRYHPGVYRIITQLDLVDTDRFLAPQVGHYCKEEFIQGTEVQRSICTAEAGLVAIVFSSLFEQTSETHVHNRLEYELFDIEAKLQVRIGELLYKFHRKFKKKYLPCSSVDSRNWRDSPEALSELNYVRGRIALLRRDF